MKKLITYTLSFLFLTLNYQLFSQECGAFNRNFDSLAYANQSMLIKDRFGNSYTFSNVAIRNGIEGDPMGIMPYQMIPPPCQAGMFKIHFAPDAFGFGFSDSANRAVICQVFSDISRLLFDIAPSNPARVNIWVCSNQSFSNLSAAGWPPGVGALASSFKVIPIGLNNTLLDNEVAKTIKGGKNSYSDLPSYLIPPDADGLFHGYMAFNFTGTAWYNKYLDNKITTSQFDLYTTALHEAMHLLGIASNLDADNGSSRLGNNIYSNIDQFFTKGTSPSNKVLVFNTTTKTWNYTAGILGLMSSCNNTASSIYHNSANVSAQEIFSPFPSQIGSSLSHLSCSNASGFSGYATNSTPPNNYVMIPGSGMGINFMKRHPDSTEVKILCDLGYSLQNIGGIFAYGDNPSNTYIYKTYSDCSSNQCYAIGYPDTFYNTPYMTAKSIAVATILANDKNGNFIDTSDIRLIPSYAGTVSQMGSNLVYTPAADFAGDVLIAYYPKCSQSGIKGSISYVFIKVLPPAMPACNDDNSCNLFCYGDFEAALVSKFYSNFKIVAQGNTVDLYSKNSLNQVCLRDSNGVKTTCNFAATSCFSINTANIGTIPNNTNQFLGLVGNSTYGSEAFVLKTRKKLVAGKSYKLTLYARKSLATCSPSRVAIFGDTIPPCPESSGVTLLNGSVNSCGFKADSLGKIDTVNSTNWTKYSLTFTPSRALSYFVFKLNVLDTPNAYGYVYFDEVSIEDLTVTKLKTSFAGTNLNPCINSPSSMNIRVCIDTPNSSSNPNPIKIKVTLPAGFQIAAGGAWNALGEATIGTGTFNTSTICLDIPLNYTMNSSIVAGISYPISVKVIDSNNCYQTNVLQQTSIMPVSSPITFSKTASSNNPNTGDTVTFALSVCNHATVPFNGFVIRDTIPSGMTLVTNGGFTQSGNILSKTDSLLAAPSTGSTSCKYYTYKAIATSLCMAENCAYLTMTGSPCISTKSCVQLNSANNFSFVLAPKTAKLCNGDSLSMSATVTPSTTTGITYQWQKNNVNITGATLSNYKANLTGVYRVILSKNGCVQSDSHSLTISSPIIVSDSIIRPHCVAMNGAIYLKVSGGIPPYQYIWFGSGGVTTSYRTGLGGPNSYPVYVRDSNNCSVSKTINLFPIIDTVKLNATLTQPSCTNPTGSIALAPSGGTSPYYYLWNNNATTQNRTGLSAGTYSVTVKDANLCSITGNFTINTQPSTNLSIVLTPTYTCTTANINSTITNGQAPFTYLWSTGATTANITNVNTTGNPTISLTVTDVSGCSKSASIVMTNFIDVGTGTSYPTASSATGAGKPFNSGVGTTGNVNMKVRINGTFTVNQLLSFDKSTIIATPGSKIVVPNGVYSFYLFRTNLKSCGTTLWKGIEINGTSSIYVDSSTIEDAQYGVEIIDNAYYTMKNNTFRNNYIGIFFRPFLNTSISRMSCYNNLDNNRFYGSGAGTIKSAFTGMVTNAGYNLQYPTTAFANKSWAGIEATNINLFRTNNCIFKDMTNGILFYNTYMPQSFSNSYENIKGISNTSLASYPNGIGVYTNNNFANNSSSKTWLIVNGLGKFSSPNFKKCDYAIKSVNCSQENIYDNHIDSSTYYGIYSLLSSQFKVENNTIKGNGRGVYVQNSWSYTVNPNGLLYFADNDLTIAGSDTVQNSAEFEFIQNVPYNAAISNNNITAKGTFGYGMRLANFKSTKFPTNQIPIANNQISLVNTPTATTAPFLGGISYYNSKVKENGSIVFSNNRTAQNTVKTPAGLFPIGIQYSYTEGPYRCDSIANIRTGARFVGTCNTSSLEKNKFFNHITGLQLENNATVTRQNNKGNTWKGLYTGGLAANSGQSSSTLTEFKVGSALTKFWAIPRNPARMFSGNTGSETDVCVNGNFAPPYTGGGSTQLSSAIASSSISFSAYNTSLVYQNELKVYHELIGSINSLSEESAEKQFLLARQNTNMGIIAEIQSQEESIFEYSESEKSQIQVWNDSSTSKLVQLELLDSLYQNGDSATQVQIADQIEGTNETWTQLRETMDAFYADKQIEANTKANNLLSLNATIDPVNITETLQKSFNEVYFNSFARGETNLNQEQIATYEIIAAQCPHLNADVVYRSRAILRGYDDTRYYDDEYICDTTNPVYQEGVEDPIPSNPNDTISCSLAPNPTSDLTTISFSSIPTEIVIIRVSNAQGTALFEEELLLTSGTYNINTSTFNEGIYNVQVVLSSSNVQIYGGQLQISRE